MRSRIIVAVTAAAVVVAFAYCSLHSSVAETRADSGKAGKDARVFLIYTDGAASVAGGGVVITDLHREDFHGIPCLAGEAAKGWVTWLAGKTVRVPIAKVTTVIEFDSVNAWKKSCETHEKESQ